MEGSDNGLSPDPFISHPGPKSSPSVSGENNENDSCQCQMISKFHNPKKQVARHFMSPTMSATSKIAVPRKKILTERNENSSFSNTQTLKTLETKTVPANSSHFDLSSRRFISSKNCPSVSNAEDFVADSSSKPYNPLTNYLSPRPKYLRYDPSKRHKIFNCQVRESREGKDGMGIKRSVSFDSEKAVDISEEDSPDSSVCAKEQCLNQENLEEIDDNIDHDDNVEDEEAEGEKEEENEQFEETGWSLRRVMKYLLILFVCFLSKTYICSLNSSMPSQIQQAILSFKDDYLMIQKQICEAAYVEVYGGFLEEEETKVQGHNMHMVEDNKLDIAETSETEMEDKNTELVGYSHGYEVGQNYELGDVQMNEVENGEETESIEVDNLEGVESSETEIIEDHTLDVDNGYTMSVEYDFDDDIVESGEAEIIEDHTLDVDDGYTISVEYDFDDVVKTGKISKLVSLAVAAASIGVGEVDCIVEGFEKCIGDKPAQIDDDGGFNLVKEIEGSDQFQKLETLEMPDSFRKNQTPLDNEEVKRPDMETVVSHEMHVNLVYDTDKEFDFEGEAEKVRTNILVVAGVSAFSMILTSVALLGLSRKGKTSSTEDSQSILKAFKSAVEAQTTPVCPALEEDHIEKMTLVLPAKGEEHIRKENRSSTKALSSSSIEAPKEIGHYIHAPTVEFLGEIVIGEVGGCHRKMVLESEKGNSSQKGPNFHSVSASRPLAQDISSQDLPSYGSFTDERKILKKKGGKIGEPKVEFITPVRRSSRIQNRSVMSP